VVNGQLLDSTVYSHGMSLQIICRGLRADLGYVENRKSLSLSGGNRSPRRPVKEKPHFTVFVMSHEELGNWTPEKGLRSFNNLRIRVLPRETRLVIFMILKSAAD
jgi:hypothetical protein